VGFRGAGAKEEMITEIIGDATLYLGDCKDILPGLGQVDAVVTDPPYGIGRDGQRKSTGSHGGRKGFKFMGWDSDRPGKEIFRLFRERSKHQIIWGGNYFADLLPASSKWLVWDKGQKINQSDGELAWTSLEGALRIKTINRMAILLDRSCHPTQKPIALMEWCIGFLPDSETILDPFMGSGTTGVAALNLGRKFIGVEKEAEYFEIACKRISDAERQDDFFIQGHKQEQLKMAYA